jgi:adenosylhomocysteine nucleosidase
MSRACNGHASILPGLSLPAGRRVLPGRHVGVTGRLEWEGMPASLAIIAALPREIAALVQGYTARRELLAEGIYLYELPDVVIVAAGMGAERAALAVRAARSVAPVTTLLSAGLAGACTPRLKAGELAEPVEVVNVLTGERCYPDSPQQGVLATSDSVADIATKRRLLDTYPADLVDMEAATVGRLAAAHGLRFRVVKAISDGYDFELPALNRFTGKQGSFRTGAFAMHVALRPALWSTAARLGRDSNLALKQLHARLLEITAAEKVSS